MISSPNTPDRCDAGILGRRFPGAGECDKEVRDRSVRNEALPPVNDPVAAIAACAGAQVGRARAGSGLGERERCDRLAGGDALKPLLLLLIGAEVDQHQSGDAIVGAEHRPQRQRGVPELHRQLDILP
jgi:hypothetical protein